jgi:hypothetical protein
MLRQNDLFEDRGANAHLARAIKASPLYNANLTKASLKLPESRVIASLLLAGVDAAEWKRAIVEENVLQKRSPSTARTFADYIRHRLETMPPEIWEIVRDAPNTSATQAVLAAALKHSRLLADFFDLVLRDQVRQFKSSLTDKNWEDFIEGCIARDPTVAHWTPPVIGKLRQNIFRILAEAGYVTDTQTMTLQRVSVAGEVLRVLEEHGESQVLRCLQAAS